MDQLGRYYTTERFSKLLIDIFQSPSPNTVIDLGLGGGALMFAARKRWENASFIGADIDQESIKNLSQVMPFIKAFHADTLTLNIEKKIGLLNDTIDVAVSNPPYLVVKKKKAFDELFTLANLPEFCDLPRITSDIVFLAQNLKMLRPSGELGIILPDGILTGREFLQARKGLLSRHNLKSIIELPERIFSKTDAKTHIVLIEKNGVSNSRIPIYAANKKGETIDCIEVATGDLECRMDFTYHNSRSKEYIRPKITLKDVDHTLKRGRQTHAELKTSNVDFIHTTSFKHGDIITIDKNVSFEEKYILAEKGDIVIARVGSRCLGKAAYIADGKVPISDCLFVIKSKQQISQSIWDFVISINGQRWLKAQAHGVCSKVINKADLMNLPILK